MRILHVEDDKSIASFVVKGLKEAGHVVDHVIDGEDGLHRILAEEYDVAIIDLMLPKLDGLSLISEMRQKGRKTPVIILSAKRSVDDRVRGLEGGSDDYLTKPFAFAELIARIHALVRRASNIPDATRLTMGDLSIDIPARRVVRAGQTIDLQPREFALLEYLMRNAGRVISKTMIMEHVWDYNFDPQTNVVETRISRLRDKINRGFQKQLIETVRGAGYVLREDS